MAAIRWIAAGGLLIARVEARRRAPAAGAVLGSLAVLGVLLLGFGNGGVVWAEQTVPSGLTAVLVATAPFWMVGIDALMPDGEPLTARRVIGLLVGFGGIVLLVWPELHGGQPGARFLGGVVATQIACFGWAVGSTYARRHAREENVLATAAFEMLFGGLILLVAGLASREWAALAFNPRTAGALAYLMLVGGDRRLLRVRVRAEASAGRDRVALRVRQSGDRRGAGHAGAEGALQRANDGRGRRRRAAGNGAGAEKENQNTAEADCNGFP